MSRHMPAYHHSLQPTNIFTFFSRHIAGIKISDCLLPCLRTVATVVEGTTTKWDGNLMFSLAFNEEVRVKKTSVDKFSFMDSLNFFGSNLGLWPGLGLFQILDWMLGIFLVSQIWKKISSIMFGFSNINTNSDALVNRGAVTNQILEEIRNEVVLNINDDED